MGPCRVLTKVFHPGVCNTINKNKSRFNHFETEAGAIFNAIPCPASVGKGTQVTAERQNTIEKKDTAFDQVSNTTKYFPGSTYMKQKKN